MAILGRQRGSDAIAAYSIGHSVRFNAPDSAYMYWTPGSAGDRKKFTFSAWVKRSLLGSAQSLFSCGVAADSFDISFTAGDLLSAKRVVGSSTDAEMISVAVYRDPSAWYHIVVAQSAADLSLKIYVNGAEVAYGTSNAPSNVDGAESNTVAHSLGRNQAGANAYFGGYMADVVVISGQQLTPSSFGETNATTNQWVPKDISALTRGTTGFYLDFADGAAAANLGYDQGAGTNDFTVSGISVAAGVGNDWLTDSPTNNYCTLNPLNVQVPSPSTLSNGNLDATTIDKLSFGTFGMKTGKWYFEMVVAGAPALIPGLGLATATRSLNTDRTVFSNGNKWDIASQNFVAYGSAFANGDIMMYAFDADNGKWYGGKNGTWFASGDPAAGANPAYTFSVTEEYFPFIYGGAATVSINFGQRAFAYTPPTGFLALCTSNLPTPTIVKSSTQFNVKLYTANGNDNLAQTGVGFQPDLVWIKSRDHTTDNTLYDSVRGVQKRLESNQTDAEVTSDDGLLSFDADGFTLGQLDQVNHNGANNAAWCWKKGATPGFDIVAYTGNNAAQNIAHALGVAPEMMIVKNLSDASTGWCVYHKQNTAAPEADYLLLNSANATADDATIWNDTAPTSSVFTVGTALSTNTKSFIALLFSSVAGFSRFGTFTATGNADGVFVYLGFRAKWLLIKTTSASDNWYIIDCAVDTKNATATYRIADGAGAEGAYSWLDVCANGFKVRNTVPANGAVQIYAAFAEYPFKYANAR